MKNQRIHIARFLIIVALAGADWRLHLSEADTNRRRHCLFGLRCMDRRRSNISNKRDSTARFRRR